MRNICVQGRDIERSYDGSAGDLALDTFQLPQKIWGVMDVRWDLRDKGFKETVNEQGDAFSG